MLSEPRQIAELKERLQEFYEVSFFFPCLFYVVLISVPFRCLLGVFLFCACLK